MGRPRENKVPDNWTSAACLNHSRCKDCMSLKCDCDCHKKK